MSGSDILGIINISSGTNPGRSLFSRPINPSSMDETRLKQISKLYSRWRPKSLSLVINGSGSATTFGSVAVGWVADSGTALAGSDPSNVQRVMACRPSKMCRLNQSSTLRIPCDTTRKWYVANGTPDDAEHGKIAVVVAATTGGYTGSTSFTVQLNWTVEFEGAELQTVESEEFIYPDVGYSELFTTSDSSWNSNVLTLKMHHGGSMVPFSSAHPGHIYKPAPGTIVKYYLEDKTTLRDALWFAIVQGYQTPGIVMFASRADAQTYIRTGDTAKCLKYFTQGPVATPSRPAFEISDAETVSVSEREAYESRLKHLERLLADLTPTTLVTDPNTNVLAETNQKIQRMPDGTLESPFKVLVEDPVAKEFVVM